MKILELNFEKTWRGGERQSLYLMKGLRNIGVEVEVLCRKGYPLHKKNKDSGNKTHSFDNIFQVIIFLILHGRKYDILHAETAQILTYCVFTKPFHRTKVAYTRRVDFVPKGILTKLKYLLTDMPIAISRAIKRILEDFSGKDITNISDIVVPKELDKERAAKVLNNLNIDNSKPIIATVAAMVPHKDPLTMVECVKALKESGLDFQFVHFGNGELDERLKQKVKENALEDVYTFAGFQEDVEDFFTLFDVFVMSSEEEGLGSSVLDAFIYKVPVVSTSAGGLVDLLENNRGILCGIKKPQELANSIIAILKDEQRKNEMIERAYSYVIDNHSMDTISQQYKSNFERLLS